MVSTPTIREFILQPDKTPLIHSAVAEGVTQYGMQTFDQSVMQLLRDDLISEEEALKNCNNPNELALKLKGISATSDRLWQPVAPGDDEDGGSPSRPGLGSAAGSGRGRPGVVRE
jgi:twitching motility protein PilT